MSVDTETRPDKKGFWGNLFGPRRLRKLEKDRPPGDEANGQAENPTPVQPPPTRTQTPGRTSTPSRSQTPVRHQNGSPEHKRPSKANLPEPLPSHRHKGQGQGAATASGAAGKDKGKGKLLPSSRSELVMAPGPLTEWPPWRVPKEAELSLDVAVELISRGVPIHNGHKRDVPHASDDYFTLYTTTSGNHTTASAHAHGSSSGSGASSSKKRAERSGRQTAAEEGTDGANLHDAMTQLMTMRTTQAPSGPQPPAVYPWETLEQPSFAFCFGRRPGTVTLNHWASLSGVLPPSIALRDSGVRPRDVDLAQIGQRLRELQSHGLDDDDEERLYRSLYRRLLRDPDRVFAPHRTLDKQITDLIMALSRPDYWIDFTHPRNQVVTRFLFDTSHASLPQYARFLHQVLLSLELDLRISSRHHSDWAKEKLLQQLPPTLQANLALARRWRDLVRVDAYGKTADQVKLRFKLKNRQIRMLRRFARMMKWPNLAATVANIKQRDDDGTLESVSSHAMAFFSGLILPGPTFPFTIMNALIDVDPDPATNDLSMLTHLHPHCGFQYRNSYTYWTSTSIVGKVLAPTCRELAGWVGPARPTVDLARSQIARIRLRRPRQRLTVDDVRSMNERSDPLGPPSEVFPVSEYKLVTTDVQDIVDTVRIELLSLRPAASASSTSSAPNSASSEEHPLSLGRTPAEQAPASSSSAGDPQWFDAVVQFAIDGVSWPMRLNYDVSFICAWPCSDGPHPLFFDYSFVAVKADMVVDINDWALPFSDSDGASGAPRNSTPRVHFAGVGVMGPRFPPVSKDGDEDKVLVVETFGVSDNEVLARAWCAHWGLSAVVADVNTTCMACAIREAYAACVTVVILVDGQTTYGED